MHLGLLSHKTNPFVVVMVYLVSRRIPSTYMYVYMHITFARSTILVRCEHSFMGQSYPLVAPLRMTRTLSFFFSLILSLPLNETRRTDFLRLVLGLSSVYGSLGMSDAAQQESYATGTGAKPIARTSHESPISWAELRDLGPEVVAHGRVLRGVVVFREEEYWRRGLAKVLRLRDQDGAEHQVTLAPASPQEEAAAGSSAATSGALGPELEEQLRLGAELEIQSPRYHRYLDGEEGTTVHDAGSSLRVLRKASEVVLPTSEKIRMALSMKAYGNHWMTKKQAHRAKTNYQGAIDLLNEIQDANATQEEVAEARSLQSLCGSNLMFIATQEGEWQVVIKIGEELSVHGVRSDLRPKVLYRMALAFTKLGSRDIGLEYALKAKEAAIAHAPQLLPDIDALQERLRDDTASRRHLGALRHALAGGEEGHVPGMRPGFGYRPPLLSDPAEAKRMTQRVMDAAQTRALRPRLVYLCRSPAVFPQAERHHLEDVVRVKTVVHLDASLGCSPGPLPSAWRATATRTRSSPFPRLALPPDQRAVVRVDLLWLLLPLWMYGVLWVLTRLRLHRAAQALLLRCIAWRYPKPSEGLPTAVRASPEVQGVMAEILASPENLPVAVCCGGVEESMCYDMAAAAADGYSDLLLHPSCTGTTEEEWAAKVEPARRYLFQGQPTAEWRQIYLTRSRRLWLDGHQPLLFSLFPGLPFEHTEQLVEHCRTMLVVLRGAAAYIIPPSLSIYIYKYFPGSKLLRFVSPRCSPTEEEIQSEVGGRRNPQQIVEAMDKVASACLRDGDVTSAANMYATLENMDQRFSRLARLCRVLSDPHSVPVPHRHNDACEALLDHSITAEILVGKDLSVEAIQKKYQRLVILVHPDKNPNPRAKEAFLRLATMREEAKDCLYRKLQAKAAQEERIERERRELKRKGRDVDDETIIPNLSELKNKKITLKALKRKDIDDDFEIFVNGNFGRRERYNPFDIDDDDVSNNSSGLAQTVPVGKRAKRNKASTRSSAASSCDSSKPIPKKRVDLDKALEEARKYLEEEDELQRRIAQKKAEEEAARRTQQQSPGSPQDDEMAMIRGHITGLIDHLALRREHKLTLHSDLSYDAYRREKKDGAEAPGICCCAPLIQLKPRKEVPFATPVPIISKSSRVGGSSPQPLSNLLFFCNFSLLVHRDRRLLFAQSPFYTVGAVAVDPPTHPPPTLYYITYSLLCLGLTLLPVWRIAFTTFFISIVPREMDGSISSSLDRHQLALLLPNWRGRWSGHRRQAESTCRMFGKKGGTGAPPNRLSFFVCLFSQQKQVRMACHSNKLKQVLRRPNDMDHDSSPDKQQPSSSSSLSHFSLPFFLLCILTPLFTIGSASAPPTTAISSSKSYVKFGLPIAHIVSSFLFDYLSCFPFRTKELRIDLHMQSPSYSLSPSMGSASQSTLQPNFSPRSIKFNPIQQLRAAPKELEDPAMKELRQSVRGTLAKIESRQQREHFFNDANTKISRNAYASIVSRMREQISLYHSVGVFIEYMLHELRNQNESDVATVAAAGTWALNLLAHQEVGGALQAIAEALLPAIYSEYNPMELPYASAAIQVQLRDPTVIEQNPYFTHSMYVEQVRVDHKNVCDIQKALHRALRNNEGGRNYVLRTIRDKTQQHVRYYFSAWRQITRRHRILTLTNEKRQQRHFKENSDLRLRVAFNSWKLMVEMSRTGFLTDRLNEVAFQLENAKNQFQLQCFRTDRLIQTTKEAKAELDAAKLLEQELRDTIARLEDEMVAREKAYTVRLTEHIKEAFLLVNRYRELMTLLMEIRIPVEGYIQMDEDYMAPTHINLTAEIEIMEEDPMQVLMLWCNFCVKEILSSTYKPFKSLVPEFFTGEYYLIVLHYVFPELVSLLPNKDSNVPYRLRRVCEMAEECYLLHTPTPQDFLMHREDRIVASLSELFRRYLAHRWRQNARTAGLEVAKTLDPAAKEDVRAQEQLTAVDEDTFHSFMESCSKDLVEKEQQLVEQCFSDKRVADNAHSISQQELRLDRERRHGAPLRVLAESSRRTFWKVNYKALLDIRQQVGIVSEAQLKQVVVGSLQMILKKKDDILSRIFYFYAGEDAQTMSEVHFWRFVECSSFLSESGALTKEVISQVLDKVISPQLEAAMKAAAHGKAEMDIKTIMTVAQKEIAIRQVQPSQFVQVMLRLSAEFYGTQMSFTEGVNRFLDSQKIPSYEELPPLIREFYSPDVQHVMDYYCDDLFRVFFFYLKQQEQSKVARDRLIAVQDGGRFAALFSVRSYITMFEDCDFIRNDDDDEGGSMSDESDQKTIIAATHLNFATPKQIETGLLKMKAGRRSIAATEATLPGGNADMTFTMFLESFAVFCHYWCPDPFIPLARKLAAFVGTMIRRLMRLHASSTLVLGTPPPVSLDGGSKVNMVISSGINNLHAVFVARDPSAVSNEGRWLLLI
eukprot:gene291-164_t